MVNYGDNSGMAVIVGYSIEHILIIPLPCEYSNHQQYLDLVVIRVVDS